MTKAEPEVLFLDEPIIGLNVVSKQAVRAFLATLGITRWRRTTSAAALRDISVLGRAIEDVVARLCLESTSLSRAIAR